MKILSSFDANFPICWIYWIFLTLVPLYPLEVQTPGFQWLSPFYLILKFNSTTCTLGLASEYLSQPPVTPFPSQSEYLTSTKRLFHQKPVASWNQILALDKPMSTHCFCLWNPLKLGFNLKSTWATEKKPDLFFLATLQGMWDISSLIRDWTHAPCSGSPEP